MVRLGLGSKGKETRVEVVGVTSQEVHWTHFSQFGQSELK